MNAYAPFVDADDILDTLRDNPSCACGSPEPARLGDGGCSDCVDYPGCATCGRWLGLAEPFAHEEGDHG